LDMYLESTHGLKKKNPVLYKLIQFIIDFPDNLPEEYLLDSNIDIKSLASILEIPDGLMKEAVKHLKEIVTHYEIINIKLDKKRDNRK
jgi:hypothetical protein